MRVPGAGESYAAGWPAQVTSEEVFTPRNPNHSESVDSVSACGSECTSALPLG